MQAENALDKRLFSVQFCCQALGVGATPSNRRFCGIFRWLGLVCGEEARDGRGQLWRHGGRGRHKVCGVACGEVMNLIAVQGHAQVSGVEV